MEPHPAFSIYICIYPHVTENTPSMSENFLEKIMMSKRLIPCSKCSAMIEAPPTATTIHCSKCDPYIMVPNKRASKSNPDFARDSRPASLTATWQIYKPVNNPGGTQPRFKKRALLCGVSYKGLKYKLKGTINDVKKMKHFLIDRFDFPVQSIRILTEEQTKEETNTPTRKNIENGLKWLVQDCQAGDSLVFYFSGHGLRQPDFEGDEVDGYDETLCPVDFRQEGMILDNDINSIIVKPLLPGVTLHAIIDACHSGTILDLHYTYNRQGQKWEEDKPPSGRSPKTTSGGRAICFSACRDSQRAVDTTIFSKKKSACVFAQKEMLGAMTSLFVEAIGGKSTNRTYAQILELMDEKIREFNIRGCFIRPHLRRLFQNDLRQEAQLSSSEAFDVDEVFNL